MDSLSTLPMLSNFKLTMYLIALAVFCGGAFFIYKLNRDNKELTFERDNLKTTLEVRNDYIDRLRENEEANEEFREKEYEKIDSIKQDSAIDPNILGDDFFRGLQRK